MDWDDGDGGGSLNGHVHVDTKNSMQNQNQNRKMIHLMIRQISVVYDIYSKLEINPNIKLRIQWES